MQIQGTINGIGERAGNASLEEIVMALKTRSKFFNIETGIVSEHLYQTSRLLTQLTGIDVQCNKAIVGANAFAHEAGIHQDGVLKNPLTYEIMTPESVGIKSNSMVLGKHSGRHAFREKLKEMGYELGDNALEDAFQRLKDLADKKKHIFDEDIEALVDYEMATGNDRIKVVALTVIAGTGGPQKATITLEIDSVHQTREATGSGPVDATFNAIKAIVPHEARLPLYQVHAVTAGLDAQGEVSVTISEDGRTVIGHGAHEDVMVASAKAYAHALNKPEWHRRRRAVEAPRGI